MCWSSLLGREQRGYGPVKISAQKVCRMFDKVFGTSEGHWHRIFTRSMVWSWVHMPDALGMVLRYPGAFETP